MFMAWRCYCIREENLHILGPNLELGSIDILFTKTLRHDINAECNWVVFW